MIPVRFKLAAPVTGRLPAVDELKGIAIILVILYHAGGMLAWQNTLHFDLGVDLFVLLSGVVLGFGVRYCGALPFLARRFVRILPAYWLTLTTCWVANTLLLKDHYTPLNLAVHYLGLQGFFGDAYAFAINDSFWYITLALGLYAIYCLCHTLVRFPDRLVLAGAAITAIIAFMFLLSYGPTGLFGHLVIRIPGFFVGLLIGKLLKEGQLDIPLSLPLALAGVLLFYIPYTQGVAFYTPWVALTLAAIYLFVIKRPAGAPGQWLTRGLGFLGRHSLEIFLLHQPLIRTYNVYVLAQGFNDSSPSAGILLAGAAAGLVVTLVVSVCLHRLVQKIPLPPAGRSDAAAHPTP